MARIPTYEERQQASQAFQPGRISAPDMNLDAVPRALAQAGEVVQKFGMNLAETEALTYAEKGRLFWQEELERQKAAAGPGAKDFVPKLTKSYNDWAEEYFKTIPDRAVRNAAARQMLPFREKLFSQALQYKVVEDRRYSYTLNEEANDAALKSFMLDMSDSNADLIEQNFRERAVVSGLLPDDVQKLGKALEENMALAYANKMIKDNPGALVEIMSTGMQDFSQPIDRKKLGNVQRYHESRNNPMAVSEAGAYGAMQVLPSTAADPGIAGVPNIFDFAKSRNVPFKDRSQEEIIRLLQNEKIGGAWGDVYMDGLLQRYNNNLAYAAIAYHAGAGYTDKWIQKGADFNTLGPRTKNYMENIVGDMGYEGFGNNKANFGNRYLDNLPATQWAKVQELAEAQNELNISDNLVNVVWQDFGPQTDLDSIDEDIMRTQLDIALANRPYSVKDTARKMLSDRIGVHNRSSQQRQAANKSGVWQQVLDGVSLDEIRQSEEFLSWDAPDAASFLQSYDTFTKTEPTLSQTAAYYDVIAQPAALAAMSNEQIMGLVPTVGIKHTRELLQKRSELAVPNAIENAKIEQNDFEAILARNGFPVYGKIDDKDKERNGLLLEAVQQEIRAQQQVRGPLSLQDKRQIVQDKINEKVLFDPGWFRFEREIPLAMLADEELGRAEIVVNGESFKLSRIPQEDREIIAELLREKYPNQTITVKMIVETYLNAQGGTAQ